MLPLDALPNTVLGSAERVVRRSYSQTVRNELFVLSIQIWTDKPVLPMMDGCASQDD